MTHIEIISSMLNFSLQQHINKDKTIEDLTAKLAAYEATKQAKTKGISISPKEN